MERLYYIQGIHPVCVIKDEEGILDAVERYDFEKKCFVTDWKMVMRIENDLDCQKIEESEFWDYIYSFTSKS